PGSGVGMSTSDISSSPLFLISERSCSPVLPSLMRYLPEIDLVPTGGRRLAARTIESGIADMRPDGNDVQPRPRPRSSKRYPLRSQPVPSSIGRSMMTSLRSRFPRYDSPAAMLTLCFVAVAGLTILRGVFAVSIDLRVDEA